MVSIDRNLRNSPVSSVVVTNKRGAQEATRHLLESGYRRVACITGPQRTTTAVQRLSGYRAALVAAGLAVEPSLVRSTDYKQAGGRDAVADLMAMGEPPDALFVANSLMTMGALEWLRTAGVPVPERVGLVGFDDLPWAALVNPRLTTVAQPTYELGRTAAEMLVERAAAPRCPGATRDAAHPAGRARQLPAPVTGRTPSFSSGDGCHTREIDCSDPSSPGVGP